MYIINKSLKKITYLFLFHVRCWCFACMYVCVKEGVESPGVKVIDSCELPCGCWELNQDLLEEQPVILTAELFLQALKLIFSRSRMMSLCI